MFKISLLGEKSKNYKLKTAIRQGWIEIDAYYDQYHCYVIEEVLSKLDKLSSLFYIPSDDRYGEVNCFVESLQKAAKNGYINPQTTIICKIQWQKPSLIKGLYQWVKWIIT